MNVLVLFECSGIVRDAFREKGHNAISCDIKPCEKKSPFHIQDDWRVPAYGGPNWDLIIMHPPCTAICLSGNRWYAGTKEREDSLKLIEELFTCPYPFCLENPLGVISTRIRKPDQYIQPWMFGHGEKKKTGLWLQHLPKLMPTNIVEGRKERVWSMPQSATRSTDRARTYPGIAKAMADQWG